MVESEVNGGRPGGGAAGELHIDSERYRSRRHERHRWIELYRDYFAGDPYRDEARWRTLLGYPEEVEVPRVRVNYARAVVERARSWTFSGFNGVSVSGGDREAELLERLFSRQLEPALGELFTELAVSGDALLIFREGGELPEIELVPALQFDVEPGGEFVRVSYRFERGGETREHREEHHPGLSRFYRPEPVRSRGVFGVFDSGGPEIKRTVEWPDGFTPFVHLKNRPRREQLYGTSDLRDLVRLIDDYNLKLSQRSRYLDRTLTPLIKNINGRVVGDGPSDSGVLSVTGDGVEVDYLRPDGEPGAAGAHLESLRKSISELAGVSLLDPGELSSIGALSGFALQLLLQPLIRLTERKRRLIFERGAKRVLEKAARLLRERGESPRSPDEAPPEIDFEFDQMFEETDA